jgi:hypothetical protein
MQVLPCHGSHLVLGVLHDTESIPGTKAGGLVSEGRQTNGQFSPHPRILPCSHHGREGLPFHALSRESRVQGHLYVLV